MLHALNNLLPLAINQQITYTLDSFKLLLPQEESLGTQEVHAFSLIFNHEETSERKHVFVTDSHRSVVQWMEVSLN